uniref:Solute carrier family 12 member 3 n=1 Tax=Heterorhabditis bacteriophora TaxID=37862 RepID=A0A1I7XVJ4_HETBA
MVHRKESRFQVSRTEPTINQQDHVLEEETNGKSSLIKNSGQKTSSTGRFMVCTENDTINPLEPALRDTNHPTNGWDNTSHDSASLIRSKGVHFSVGDKDEMKREHTDNTTFNMKSWRNIRTIEHPPIIDFYRNSVDIAECSAARPSMIQLIHGEMAIPEEMGIEDFKLHNDELVESHVQGESKALRVGMFPTPQQQTRIKFGWVQGVFIRCLLNIFGVMLYLRISWVAGQAGIGLGSLIVILAAIVTTITAISTCAICTNGDVKGGGAYFLISRSLGPEFGGSIGLIFSVANAVGAAMYIVGFAETVRDILKENDFMIIDGGIWDVRIIGFAACIILMGIVFIGTEFESKMQMGLLAILLTSILNYIVGSVFPPNEEMIKRGSTGYSRKFEDFVVTLTENFFPAFRDGENFFSVFSIYFPAATGIMAGANISGDLADPQHAIPIGTLLAIFVTTLVYLATIWMTGSTCVRDADGLNFPLWNGSTLISPQCAVNSTCPYGLMNYFQVMEMESFWGPLITAGIFAATLSSALASLVSAPKVFQAVCKDRLFPKINYFSKPYGKNEEPRRAYALAFIIAVAMIAIGDLNDIAPIISNFFLASYALINYACFDQSFADSPDVNWGSSTQAHSYKNALAGMIKLSNTEEHVKNYRPQFLVLCGNPAARPSLVDFAYSITKGSSLMICGYVVQYNPSDRVYSVIRKLDRQINEWLRKRHIKSFYSSVANSSIRAGAQSLIQVSGLGKLRPNIILIGFKSNWDGEGPTRNKLTELNDYFGTIQDAFDNNMGVCVLRNGDVGLDFSDAMKLLNLEETNRLLPDVKENMVAKDFSSSEISVRKESFTPSLQQKSDEDRESEKGELGCESITFFRATNSLTENFSFDDVEVVSY